MAMKQANAAQKKWMSDITEWSICNLGLLYGPEYDGAAIQRHHVLGRSAKHNKVAIGHWFILPVPYELHDPNESHYLHVGKCKHAFTAQFGTQRSLFMKMYNDMYEQGYDMSKIPFEVTLAIGDTSA